MHLPPDHSSEPGRNASGKQSLLYPLKARKEPWFILPPTKPGIIKSITPVTTSPSCLPGYLPTHDSRLFELIYPRHNSKVHIPLEQSASVDWLSLKQPAAHQDKDARIYWNLDETTLALPKESINKEYNPVPGFIPLVDDFGNEIKLNYEVVE